MLAVVFVFASLCFNMAAPKPKRARKDKKELEEDLGILADVLDMKGTKAEQTHGEQKVLPMPGPEHVLKHLRDHFVTFLQIIVQFEICICSFVYGQVRVVSPKSGDKGTGVRWFCKRCDFQDSSMSYDRSLQHRLGGITSEMDPLTSEFSTCSVNFVIHFRGYRRICGWKVVAPNAPAEPRMN